MGPAAAWESVDYQDGSTDYFSSGNLEYLEKVRKFAFSKQ